MKTLIIIPTYNERENIGRIIPAVFKEDPEFHILVVDDGSPDGTADIVNKLQQKYPDHLYLMERSGKGGLATAYIAGFGWGLERDYEVIGEFDADFSHDPKYLKPIIQRISDGADFVVGSRYVKGGDVEGWGLIRRITSQGGSLYSRLILGGSIRDLTGGFNFWKREVLESLPFDQFVAKGYLFQIEMKHRSRRSGFKGVEHPIVFKDRTEGVSKMSGGIFLEALRQVWVIRNVVR